MEKKVEFYHEVKEHISPSAMESWIRQRSSFIKSYFEGQKGPETAAMTFGTQVHALIEHGMLNAQKKYDKDEAILKHEAGDGLYMLGKPDSYNSKVVKNTVEFVDYKTGKASEWEKKLPTDIKMKATAWLVWMETGKPAAVKAHIEFLQTTWDEDKQQMTLLEKDTEITSITYQKADLEEFTDVIIRTMEEINTFYLKWIDRTAEFIDEKDCRELQELRAKRDEIDEQMSVLTESIESQMDFGGMMSYKLEGVGQFSIRQTKTFKIPTILPFKVGKKKYTMEDFIEIQSAAKAAEKNFKITNEPISTSTSISFTPVKDKK